MNDPKGKRGAWREPMVWLVFAIPAVAIVFTVALLAYASRSSGTDDAVADKVQRTAQVQVADLGPDATAMHIASVMTRQHSPMVAVVDGGTVLGVITVHRFLGALLPRR